MDDIDVNLLHKYPQIEKSLKLSNKSVYDLIEQPEWLSLMSEK